MVIARQIYDTNLAVLMGEGTVLNSSHISRIRELGYSGAYVFEAMGGDIDVQGVVSDKLYLSAVKAAMDMLNDAENARNRPGVKKLAGEQIKGVVSEVIMSVISSGHRLADMFTLRPTESYSYFHAASVLIIAILIGVEMGIAGRKLEDLGSASLLHDIREIFVPDGILQKAGGLTADEREAIKQSTEKAFEFMRGNLNLSIESCSGVFQSNENFDGSGYPMGLRGDKISLIAKIISVAEAYDALTSTRPFRKEPMYPHEALEFISYQAGSMYDPQVVDVLKQVVAPWPPGLSVELSSGVRALVIQNNIGHLDRPIVRLIGTVSRVPVYIDLLRDPRFEAIRISGVADD